MKTNGSISIVTQETLQQTIQEFTLDVTIVFREEENLNYYRWLTNFEIKRDRSIGNDAKDFGETQCRNRNLVIGAINAFEGRRQYKKDISEFSVEKILETCAPFNEIRGDHRLMMKLLLRVPENNNFKGLDDGRLFSFATPELRDNKDFVLEAINRLVDNKNTLYHHNDSSITIKLKPLIKNLIEASSPDHVQLHPDIKKAYWIAQYKENINFKVIYVENFYDF